MRPQDRATRIGATCLFAAVLSACATPYQDMGFRGGVEAMQIDSNTVRISARGNAFTDIRRMKDYVLLKAAETTVSDGYDLFELNGTENVTRTVHYSSTSYHHVPVTTFGPDGVSFGSANVPVHSEGTLSKPGEDIYIKMFNGTKPADAPENEFDAREVITFLGPHILGDDFAGSAAAVSLNTPRDPKPADVPTAQLSQASSQVIKCDAKQDADLAKLARANDYQYSSGCKHQN